MNAENVFPYIIYFITVVLRKVGDDVTINRDDQYLCRLQLDDPRAKFIAITPLLVVQYDTVL